MMTRRPSRGLGHPRPHAAFAALRGPAALGAAFLALTFSGCVPLSTGNQMREDITRLSAQQQALIETQQSEREELNAMVASARKDVKEIERVLTEARELLERNNANLGVELQTSREEIERLRGNLEEIDFRMSRTEQDLKLFKNDVDLRFANTATSVALPDAPDALLEMASRKLSESDPRTARRALEKFLEKNAQHPKADEAVYLLGETYFAEGHWFGAIGEFQKVLKQFAKSARHGNATLRIGESLGKLGKCKEANVFFESVVSDYPGARNLVRDARDHMQAIKSGKCPL